MDEKDPLAPNAEDWDGAYFDPWEAIGLRCCSYNSEIDRRAIDVLREIARPEFTYCNDIAEKLELSPVEVELWQGIFCSANWCEYGTSPRGCWIVHDHGPDFGERLIAAWEAYFERKWLKEEA